MFSLRLRCAPGEVDLVSAELWEAGTAGIRELEEEDGVSLIASFETNDTRLDLLDRFASHEVSWTQEDSTNWIEATHRAWPARAIGQRIFLAPAWSTDDTPLGRVRVIHNPGLACGTGEHPCTQLALMALESVNLAGKTLVDIGTGSGVLAMAALRLGASMAIGLDTDEAALGAARENFGFNDLPPLLAAGSADCLSDACAAITVANISATVLLFIADELLRITGPGGQLILSGFDEYELAAIQENFGEGEITSCAEWRCLRVQLS
jgi:ribosomal protein L11 methyltransferase